MIRILLVDDQNLVRQGLQALLSSNQELQIVGYAANGKDALERVAQHRPDIVLIDIEMPQMNGIVATQKICQQFPKTKVIVLSSHEHVKYVTQSLQAGAKGYLLKETLFEDLEKAIELVGRGYSQIESKLLAKAIADTKVSDELSSKPKPQRAPTRKNEFEVSSQNSVSHSRAESKVGSGVKYSENTAPQNPSSTAANTTLPRESRANAISATDLYGLHLQSDKSSKSHSESTSVSKTSLDRQRKPSTSEDSHNLSSSPSSLEPKPSSKPNKPTFGKVLIWGVACLVLVVAGSIAVTTWTRFFNRSQPLSSPNPTSANALPPEITTVAALGRIRPQGEVISLSAPTSLEAIQVEKLLVREGDRVEAGQMVAILDGRERQEAALAEARTGVEIAKARLERVKAGAKQGAIAAKQAAIANLRAELAGEKPRQQATIAKLTAQLNNARSQLQRHQQLYDRGAISTSLLDSKILAANTAQEQLNEAQANFERTQRTLEARIQEASASLQETQEIRPVEVQIARAELERAKAAVNKAESDMELAYVRTPLAGEILAIHTRPGEALNQKGIVEIAQTDQMIVLAEVDQNDINRVKLGQKATVTTRVFAENLQGKVERISSLIGKNDILDTDPTADEDTRVVEVQILLAPEDSQKVAKLTNLEVDVAIDISSTD